MDSNHSFIMGFRSWGLGFFLCLHMHRLGSPIGPDIMQWARRYGVLGKPGSTVAGGGGRRGASKCARGAQHESGRPVHCWPKETKETCVLGDYSD